MPSHDDMWFMTDFTRLSRIALVLDYLVYYLRIMTYNLKRGDVSHMSMMLDKFEFWLCGGDLYDGVEHYSFYRQLVYARRDFHALFWKRRYVPFKCDVVSSNAEMCYTKRENYIMDGVNSDDEDLEDVDKFQDNSKIRWVDINRIYEALYVARVRFRSLDKTESQEHFMKRVLSPINVPYPDALGFIGQTKVPFLTLAILARKAFRSYMTTPDKNDTTSFPGNVQYKMAYRAAKDIFADFDSGGEDVDEMDVPPGFVANPDRRCRRITLCEMRKMQKN